jgi:hypothetical protein
VRSGIKIGLEGPDLKHFTPDRILCAIVLMKKHITKTLAGYDIDSNLSLRVVKSYIEVHEDCIEDGIWLAMHYTGIWLLSMVYGTVPVRYDHTVCTRKMSLFQPFLLLSS